MRVFPRNVQQKVMVTFLMTYLSCQHAYSMYKDYGGYSIDITTQTMKVVCKLWIITFAYKDGGEDPKTLSKDQISRSIKEMPSVIEYLSFVFFCCSGVVGPVFEYSDYKNFMELTGNYKEMPRGYKAVDTFIPAMQQFLGAFLCIGIHFLLGVVGGYDISLVGSKDFLTYGNWFSRFIYYNLAFTAVRIGWYSPW